MAPSGVLRVVDFLSTVLQIKITQLFYLRVYIFKQNKSNILQNYYWSLTPILLSCTFSIYYTICCSNPCNHGSMLPAAKVRFWFWEKAWCVCRVIYTAHTPWWLNEVTWIGQPLVVCVISMKLSSNIRRTPVTRFKPISYYVHHKLTLFSNYVSFVLNCIVLVGRGKSKHLQ